MESVNEVWMIALVAANVVVLALYAVFELRRPRGHRRAAVPDPEAAAGAPPPAPREPLPDLLVELIRSAEAEETGRRGSAGSSRRRWHSFAAGGGSLPGTAGACRPPAHGTR